MSTTSNTTVSRSSSQNINLDYYQPNSKKCFWCNKYYTLIVNHYKKKHKKKEVCVSRLSPEMAEKVKLKDFGAERVDGKLESMCFFCQYPRAFSLSYWSDHLRVHTGEYIYKCPKCHLEVSCRKHCGVSTDLLETQSQNLFVDDFVGFICNDCNFVQLDEKNMKKHIEIQHKETEAEGHYQSITLLPAIKRLIHAPITDEQTMPTMKELIDEPTTDEQANGMTHINKSSKQFLYQFLH